MTGGRYGEVGKIRMQRHGAFVEAYIPFSRLVGQSILTNRFDTNPPSHYPMLPQHRKSSKPFVELCLKRQSDYFSLEKADGSQPCRPHESLLNPRADHTQAKGQSCIPFTETSAYCAFVLILF